MVFPNYTSSITIYFLIIIVLCRYDNLSRGGILSLFWFNTVLIQRSHQQAYTVCLFTSQCIISSNILCGGNYRHITNTNSCIRRLNWQPLLSRYWIGCIICVFIFHLKQTQSTLCVQCGCTNNKQTQKPQDVESIFTKIKYTHQCAQLCSAQQYNANVQTQGFASFIQRYIPIEYACMTLPIHRANRNENNRILLLLL